MPWKPSAASGKTKKAKSPAAKKQWSSTANAVLAKTGDEGKAVRIANAAVVRSVARKEVICPIPPPTNTT